MGIKGRGSSGTSRDSNPAGLCCSSAHLVQCEPDKASSFTNPNLGPGSYAGLWLELDTKGLVPYIGFGKSRGDYLIHTYGKKRWTDFFKKNDVSAGRFMKLSKVDLPIPFHPSHLLFLLC